MVFYIVMKAIVVGESRQLLRENKSFLQSLWQLEKSKTKKQGSNCNEWPRNYTFLVHNQVWLIALILQQLIARVSVKSVFFRTKTS